MLIFSQPEGTGSVGGLGREGLSPTKPSGKCPDADGERRNDSSGDAGDKDAFQLSQP